MDFIKRLERKVMGKNGFATAVIDGGSYLFLRFPNDVDIKEVGFVEGGIGVVYGKRQAIKSPYSLGKYHLDKEDIPEQLAGESYRFLICAPKPISEGEVIFYFKDAIMMNSKK